MQNKLKLYGFNNLTKALSFKVYDVCYVKDLSANSVTTSNISTSSTTPND